MPAIKVPAGWTLAGLAAGLGLGAVLQGSRAFAVMLPVIEPLGALWLRALQMTIVPLVASLLFIGVTRAVQAAQAASVTRHALGLIVAILTTSAIMGALVTPLVLDAVPIPQAAVSALHAGAVPPASQVPGFADFLGSLLSKNIIDAAPNSAMLPLVVFMGLFALASTRLAAGPQAAISSLFEGIAGAMLVMIGWVLALAPIGVFALALGLAAVSGAAAFGVLAHYILLVSAIGGVMLIAAYALAIGIAGEPPLAFARAMLPAQSVALSTQSSLASLPAMLASCRSLGLRDASAELVLPLAVAIFRATGPAMNMAVAIYVARLSGVAVTPATLAAGVAVAAIVTYSTVSLPNALTFVSTVGPIALAMGVPIGPLALLVAVELLPDLMRTVGNVTMDVAVTAVVDRRSART
ncbi:MAG: cation:dicarboxylase symporter family transporter [Novosphingobium sp.]